MQNKCLTSEKTKLISIPPCRAGLLERIHKENFHLTWLGSRRNQVRSYLGGPAHIHMNNPLILLTACLPYFFAIEKFICFCFPPLKYVESCAFRNNVISLWIYLEDLLGRLFSRLGNLTVISINTRIFEITSDKRMEYEYERKSF